LAFISPFFGFLKTEKFGPLATWWRAEFFGLQKTKKRRSSLMKNFRTYDLALDFYHAVSATCDRLELKGDMNDQIRRASRSIVLNLSEGSGRIGAKSRRHFFTIALGSLREVNGCLDLLKIKLEHTDKLGGMIYRLIQNPGPGPIQIPES